MDLTGCATITHSFLDHRMRTLDAKKFLWSVLNRDRSWKIERFFASNSSIFILHSVVSSRYMVRFSPREDAFCQFLAFVSFFSCRLTIWNREESQQDQDIDECAHSFFLWTKIVEFITFIFSGVFLSMALLLISCYHPIKIRKKRSRLDEFHSFILPSSHLLPTFFLPESWWSASDFA